MILGLSSTDKCRKLPVIFNNTPVIGLEMSEKQVENEQRIEEKAICSYFLLVFKLACLVY